MAVLSSKDGCSPCSADSRVSNRDSVTDAAAIVCGNAVVLRGANS